jgi:hypothetical protein
LPPLDLLEPAARFPTVMFRGVGQGGQILVLPLGCFQLACPQESVRRSQLYEATPGCHLVLPGPTLIRSSGHYRAAPLGYGSQTKRGRAEEAHVPEVAGP